MGIGDLINNFSFHNAWISVVMALLVFGSIAFGIFWYWTKKMQYKYRFEILDSQGNSSFRKAKLVKNKQGIRKFCIEGFENPEQWQSISLEPNRMINGKKYRQVAFDGKGNLIATNGLNLTDEDMPEEELKELKEKLKESGIDLKYMTKFRMDKKKYLDTSLTEVEKTVQAYAILEANQSHNVMDKAQKWIVGTIAVMCVFMFLMLFFQVKGVIQIGESAEGTASSLNQAGDKLVIIAQSLDRRTKMELLLYNQAFGDNFSLELEAT